MLTALSTAATDRPATEHLERMTMRHLFFFLAMVMTTLGMPGQASAEDGYDLWLRYRPVEAESHRRYDPVTALLIVEGRGPTIDAATAELQDGVKGMLGHRLPVVAGAVADGAIVIGTPANSPIVARLNAEITKLVARPDIKANWAKQGVEPIVMTVPEFDKFVRSEIDKWAEVVRVSGAKIN